MRNKDLKNKLDQHPIDFDREGLWRKIEQEPKKKNRLMVFWWTLSGLALLVTFYIGLKHYWEIDQKNNSEWALSETATFKGEFSKGSMLDSLSNYNIQKEIQLENLLSKELTILEESKTSYKPIVERAKKTILKKDLHYQQKIQERKEDISLYRESTESNISTQNFHLNNKRKDESSEDGFMVKETLNGESLDGLEINFESLGFIKAEGLFYQRANVLSQSINILQHKSTGEKQHQNGLALSLGFGSDLHHFEEDKAFRRSLLESNLERINARLSYQRYFFNNWVVSFSLAFTTSQTKTELSSITNGQYTRSVQDGSTYIITTETSVKLYNRYERWDGDVSLGYIMMLGNWHFTPSIGFGKNLFANALGELITLDNEIADFQDLEIYDDRLNGYWRSSFRVDRLISDRLRIALIGNFESSRTLTVSDHIHSINPISVDLQIEWLW